MGFSMANHNVGLVRRPRLRTSSGPPHRLRARAKVQDFVSITPDGILQSFEKQDL